MTEFIFEKEWSKNWTLEEFKQIWQSGKYRKYTKSRKDTNAMVAFYIDKYGTDVPSDVVLVRGISQQEKRNRIGNSWHPIKDGQASKLFWRNSRHSDAFFTYSTNWLLSKRGIHFDEKEYLYEEEWLLKSSDIVSDMVIRRNAK